MSYEKNYYTDSDSYSNGSFSDTESFSDEASLSSNMKYNKQLLKFSKNTGFYRFKKNVNNKIYKIGFYETNITPGSLIRSATTGNRFEKVFVGTYMEDLFFKVCNTTIENGKKAPIIMFFNTPEEFEKHFKCVINENVKKNWNIKYEKALERREYNINKTLYKDVPEV